MILGQVSEELCAYWQIAITDAKLQVAAALAVPSSIDNHLRTRHFRPGEPTDNLLPPDVRQELKELGWDDQFLAIHRVFFPKHYEAQAPSSIALLGLLRHELEHARQWEFLRDDEEALRLLENELEHQLQDCGYTEGEAYLRLPSELAANAAAEELMKREGGDLNEVHNGPDDQLLTGRPIAPEDLVAEVLQLAYGLPVPPSRLFQEEVARHPNWQAQGQNLKHHKQISVEGPELDF